MEQIVNGGAQGVATAGEEARTYAFEEVERMIAERVEAEREEAERRVEAARLEGEQRARQRLESECLAREAELERRAREVEARELRAEAIENLRQRGLPVRLAEALDYSGAEACEASIERLDAVMRDAIREGVDARIAAARGGVCRGNAGEGALMAQVRGVMGLK